MLKYWKRHSVNPLIEYDVAVLNGLRKSCVSFIKWLQMGEKEHILTG